MANAVEWVTDLTRFEDLADEWDALLPADAHPFDLHCWHTAWWNAFGGSSDLAVCTVRRGGELVGALPLRKDGHRLKSLANVHSCVFRPLAIDREAMDALAVAAMSSGERELDLYGLPEHDPSVSRLEAGARQASRVPLIEPLYASPFVNTRGDYETWRKENKHRWKSPLEQRRRKMGREHDAKFILVEVPSNLDAELDDGLRIEASGWKGEGGTAITSSADTTTFYRSIARAFHARNELRFSRIVLDGMAVSFGFSLLYRNRLYLLKSGYNEDYRKLAPGLVMRLGMIERCFELGIDELDLLGDEIGWKTRFASGNRPHVNLRAYSRSPLGYATYGYKVKVRPRLKSVYHGVKQLAARR